MTDPNEKNTAPADSGSKRDYVTRFHKKSDPNEVLGSIFGQAFIEYRKKWDESTRTMKAGEFPLCIVVEPVDNCNYSCGFCYRADPEKNSMASLSLESFKKTLLEVKPFGLPSISFGTGEPLLHKELPDMVRFARENGVLDVIVTTNGSFLTEERVEKLFAAGITKLHISVDSTRPETYKKIRGGDLLVVEQNIRTAVRKKKESGAKVPVIRLSFLCLEENKDEREEFLQRWGDQVDYIDFQDYVSHHEVDNLYPIEVEPFDCVHIHRSLAIRANGNVQPCCGFYGKHLVLGNILKGDTLEDLWNGEKLKELRDAFARKDYPLACKHCMGKIERASFPARTAALK